MIQVFVLCIIIAFLVHLCATRSLQPLTSEYFIVINVVTFFIYGWDKIAAINGWWRIMEFTLHVLSLIGGSPAAFIAQHLFGHKTSKVRFQMIFWFIVVIQVIGIWYLVSLA